MYGTQHTTTSQRIVELRSDTQTKPSPEMRKAMYEAEVGDAGAGEDPTVNRLEAMAAERLGKEAGLFVSSGTQGNLIAVLTQCRRGDQIILGEKTHIYLGEASAMSALGQVNFRFLDNTPDGSLDAAEVEGHISKEGSDGPRTGMISLENTQNLLGGIAVTPESIRPVAAVAHRHGLPFHIDGARIFNAEVALGIPVADLAREADTVTFCLSKGLAAPVGSVLCGSNEVIHEARRWHKYVGGVMRQAGVIAAAGIVALETMVQRMAEDHENARRLAVGLAGIGHGIEIDPESVQTNLVFCRVDRPDRAELVQRINDRGVRFYDLGADLGWRFVPHYGVSAEEIDYAVEVIGEEMGRTPARGA